MPSINPTRFLDDLHALRDFGRHDPGVVRPALSAADMDARRWLRTRMQEAGLEAAIDGVGNVLGRSRQPGPALLIGSHSDTQPRGGWLDGAFGVICGLEVARALAEDARTRTQAVDAIAWIDEEGAYLSCLGSLAFCGLLDESDIDAAANQSGETLRDALRRNDLNGVAARAEPGRYLGYLEAHIEQGGYLEEAQQQVGVVTAIVGSRNFTVRFSGQQNHAGTTPMIKRRDAGRAAVEFAYRIDQLYQQNTGPRTVWTIGQISFDPGAPSIIPGRAELHLQFRDPELSRLDAFEQIARQLVAEMNSAGPVTVSIEPAGVPIAPADMDPVLQEHLARAAAQTVPERWQRMPSAAIHDAMFLARVMPAGMLFVPSINGISHDFAEDTAEDDLVAGCQVLANAAASILAQKA